MDRLLRRPEVLKRVGFCRSSLYHHMSQGRFPRPIKIGQRSVAWSEQAIESWIVSCPISTGGMI